MASSATLASARNYRLFILNTEFLKSGKGLLKMIQIIIGLIGFLVVVIKASPVSDIGPLPKTWSNSELFFIAVSSTYLTGTFTLFLSYVVSARASEAIPDTIFDFLFHSLGSLMYFIASAPLMIFGITEGVIHRYLGGSAMGFFACVLYLMCAIQAKRKC